MTRSAAGRARTALLLLAIYCAGGARLSAAEHAGIRVASKVFTESVILGEMATQLVRDEGDVVEHSRELNGTRIVWDALVAGEIDIYPEYTGTILQEIFAGQSIGSEHELTRALTKSGIGMTQSLGFNDTYALGLPEPLAARLGIRKISDLAQHPALRFGFSNEFMERKDCWPLLRSRYKLPQTSVTGLDHDLAYRAIASGRIDLTDLYSTDAEIPYYHLRTLEDDLNAFPEYKAVFLYRLSMNQRFPRAVAAISRLEGKIDAPAMRALNARVKLDHVSETEAASGFLRRTLGLGSSSRDQSLPRQLLSLTGQHLLLVAISLSAAILVAIPLGIVSARMPRFGQFILGTVSAIYTIPALALLVFMIPELGIGATPAVAALFLYSLLPMVRNTHSGLRSIPRGILESAEVLGLPRFARLFQVELPMASAQILAGIQTSAVINVGTATLGALVGAGGYGQPIITGIRLNDPHLILFGAVPAAALALLVQGGFELLGLIVVPRGLRARPASEG